MLVTVASFTNPLEAHIARGRLEAEGIQAFVAHEHHVWANWFLSTALGGVKIQVSPPDAQRAAEILGDERTGRYEALLEAQARPAPAPVCPVCHSRDIQAVHRSERISLVVVWLSSLPLPYTSGTMKCRACGHRWVNRQQKTYPLITRLFVILILSGFFYLLVSGLYYLCRINEINPVCR